MTDILRFVLIGLGTGALYGLITQGLVLVYRGSGVLNLAQGGFVAVGAYGYYEFRVGMGMPTWASLAFAVLLGAAVGALTHVVVLKRMRHSSPLTRVVATLGILIIIQSLAVLRYGDTTKSVPSYLPTDSATLLPDISIGLDRIFIFLICSVSVGALWWVYRFTAFGRATSAVAENERAAATLGHSPDRIAVVNWALGGAFGAFAGTLIAPITFLQPNELVFLVVPALAAALLGGFSSFPLTFVSALTIGVLESIVGRYVEASGWPKAIPLIIVVLVLVLRGQNLPLRSHVLDKLPVVGSGRVRPSVAAMVFVGMTLLILFGMNGDWASAIAVTMSYALLCLSIVVATGLAGQLSLTQYVLAGVGALVGARLLGTGGSFLVAVVAAFIVAVALGSVVALPALRTRGINLAIVTFCLAIVIHSLVLNNRDLAGDALGLSIPVPTIFGWDLDPILYPERYALVVFVILFAVALGVSNLRRGAAGRRLIAVRSNERAAAASGVSVPAAKVYAFALAAGLAALGGVLLAVRNITVLPAQFEVFPSINIVAMTVVGGLGSVGGALTGSLLLPGGLSSELLRGWEQVDGYLPLIGGLLLVQTLMTDQNGLLSMNKHLARTVVAKFRRNGINRKARSTPGASLPSSDDVGSVSQRTLRIEGMVVRFDGVTAVDGVSLEVRPGEVHGLIGPNGAGKTTLIDGVTGFVRPAAGSIYLDGADLSGFSARRRMRNGVSRSFQSLELFDDLTVRENIAVACDSGSPWRFLSDLVRPGRPAISSAAASAIREFGLEDDLDSLPDSLSYGKRRLTGIVRAVASGPSVILLDEPASGLDDAESAELATLIRGLAEQRGMAVLLVEHNLDLVMQVSDRITVLTEGSLLVSGDPQTVRHHPDVLRAYMGTAGVESQVVPERSDGRRVNPTHDLATKERA